MCTLPEGASPLQASWYSLLESRKLVFREECSEALKSQDILKAGLQNPVPTNRNGIRRLVGVGEQAHLCDARDQYTLISRCCGNRRKEYALIPKRVRDRLWGGLGIDSVSMCQEVSQPVLW
ncbi:hypothetical protein [Pleomorphovibrio marinus]|uniref:hypothetical protein n=1 Tax=Pleomorphovibrio marinus TaxID=2164132 RepID=UPI000E0A09D4|nr:hypothetical protein [Pleomorphovibrio marinus]